MLNKDNKYLHSPFTRAINRKGWDALLPSNTRHLLNNTARFEVTHDLDRFSGNIYQAEEIDFLNADKLGMQVKGLCMMHVPSDV